MNNVVLSGRLTKNAEVRYGGEDGSVAIARFTLAVQDYKGTTHVKHICNNSIIYASGAGNQQRLYTTRDT